MVEELKFITYNCLCHRNWGHMFPLNKDGEVDGDIIVTLSLHGLNPGIEVSLAGERLFEYGLEVAHEDEGGVLHQATLKRCGAGWFAKAVQVTGVRIKRISEDDYLSVVFSGGLDVNLLGLEVKPHGLTNESATEEDTIH